MHPEWAIRFKEATAEASKTMPKSEAEAATRELLCLLRLADQKLAEQAEAEAQAKSAALQLLWMLIPIHAEAIKQGESEKKTHVADAMDKLSALIEKL
jgi:seryl-tRNA synthetase